MKRPPGPRGEPASIAAPASPAVSAAILVAVLAAGLVPASPAGAQWAVSPDTNNAVCAASGAQISVAAASDGRGGAIVVWEDARSDSFADIYAQHMSVDGVPLWGPDGIAVATEVFPHGPRIVSDGAGGAIIAWGEYHPGPDARLMGQRVSASGDRLWSPAGVVICSASTLADLPVMIPDGTGGAVLVWKDKRAEGWNGTDILAQRVTSAGELMWSAGGLPICVAPGNQAAPSVALATDGAVLFAWQDARAGAAGTEDDIYVQRVLAGGSFAWAANGIPATSAPGLQATPEVIPDPSGGAFVIWNESRPDRGTDLFAQRLDTAGSLRWIAAGVPVTESASLRSLHVSVPDASGGFIVAWREDRRESWFDVYAQRMDADGHALWVANGVAACDLENHQWLAGAAPDGQGGVILAWEDRRSVLESDVYTQRITTEGEAVWAPNGLAVSTAPGDQETPALVAGADGGAILAWKDERFSSTDADIFGARIRPDGALGATFLPNHFVIDAPGGGDIPEEVAGESFPIRVVARTPSGFTAVEFRGTVEISSDGELALGAGTSDSLVAGILPAHTVTFAHSGRLRIFAVASGGLTMGSSNVLTVRPPTPAGFSAVASSVGERRIELAWSPSPTGDAVSYGLYRSTRAIPDTTSFRVLELPAIAAWTDTVPDFGTYHYRVAARDVHGLSSGVSADVFATASPLFFAISTSVFQNAGATHHLDVVVGAESLLVGAPLVSLASEGDSVSTDVVLVPVPGALTTFAGSFEVRSNGIQSLRTRAAAPDGRAADRLRSFNAVLARPGGEVLVSSPDGRMRLIVPAGAFEAETCFLAETLSGDAEGGLAYRFGPEREFARPLVIEWICDAGAVDDAIGLSMERREGDAWLALSTRWEATAGVLRGTIARPGDFRVRHGGPSAGAASEKRSLLAGAAPNPFRAATVIRWALPADSELDLGIYDLNGRRVLTLVRGSDSAESRERTWDGRDANGRPVAPGLYFVQLRAAGRVESRKILRLE